MKIHSIRYDMNLKQGNYLSLKDPLIDREKTRAGVCKENKKNNSEINFSGGSPVGDAAANLLKKKSFMKTLANSGAFSSFIEYVEAHNIAAGALIALGLAGVLRPITIMSIPGKKDKEDKIYASGHSMASALIGYGFSTVVTSPFDSAAQLIVDKPENYKFTRLAKVAKRLKELEAIDKEAMTNALKKEKFYLGRKIEHTKTFMKNIPGGIIAIPRSMLTIALIPLILKYVFGVEKKSKVAVATVPPQSQPIQTQKPPISSMQNVSMASFIAKVNGGVK